MLESSIRNRIMLHVSNLGVKIFTNPVGNAWTGKLQEYKNGIAKLLGARRVSYGLHKGSPDLIGWKRVRVTPQMVGKYIAVFVGIEVKSEDGRQSPEQKTFLAALERDGALSGEARSEADAERIVTRLEV